jgi:putative transposase
VVDRYKHKITSVTDLNVHLIWIPRRRKKVLIGDIKQRLIELIYESAEKIDCKVISLAIEPDHVHLFLNYDPDLSIAQIMHRIKGDSSYALRTEFPALKKLPSMWTRAYFASSAGAVSSDTIKRYIEAQGKD